MTYGWSGRPSGARLLMSTSVSTPGCGRKAISDIHEDAPGYGIVAHFICKHTSVGRAATSAALQAVCIAL